MAVIETVLTVNALLTSILSILPNALVILLACTSEVLEIRQYRWIIAGQSFLEVAMSIALASLNMVSFQCVRLFCERVKWANVLDPLRIDH
ncbi:unnamed protein product [Anisakis simplex]|uniref:G_PROTEIN_RECEP_F1_2 domain-containing protein n=1 Tax=Anisakis simplex TaxID=6269 RepID=A0A0M3KJU8_ANISI|nr:unnamed protein product [Anisakis simplex]